MFVVSEMETAVVVQGLYDSSKRRPCVMRSCTGHREEARNQATTCGVAVSLVQFFVLWLVVGSGSGVSASAQHRTACVSATVDCTEWIELETSPQRVRVYRSHPLYGTTPRDDKRCSRYAGCACFICRVKS